MRIKSQCGRAGFVRIMYRNIDAGIVDAAVWINMDYNDSKVASCRKDSVTQFSDISIINLHVNKVDQAIQ